MTAKEELIQYILSLTPEQVKKVAEHPAFVAALEEYRSQKETAPSVGRAGDGKAVNEYPVSKTASTISDFDGGCKHE